MDIQTRKLHLIKEILDISDESIIDKLETMLKEKINEETQQSKPYSIEEAEAIYKKRMNL